jgi:hypothetical protein
MRRVAEREGFEPPVRKANNSFRGYRLQPLGHLSFDISLKSVRVFRSTGREKRRFPFPHGSNTQPLALDPGTIPRCGCKFSCFCSLSSAIFSIETVPGWRKWRRGRDSNPRYAFWAYTRLAGERLQPTRPPLRKHSPGSGGRHPVRNFTYMNKRYKLSTQSLKVKREGSLGLWAPPLLSIHQIF